MHRRFVVAFMAGAGLALAGCADTSDGRWPVQVMGDKPMGLFGPKATRTAQAPKAGDAPTSLQGAGDFCASLDQVVAITPGGLPMIESGSVFGEGMRAARVSVTGGPCFVEKDERFVCVLNGAPAAREYALRVRDCYPAATNVSMGLSGNPYASLDVGGGKRVLIWGSNWNVAGNRLETKTYRLDVFPIR